MDELASYNQGFIGPLHMAHNDPIRRPHTMQVRYQPYDGNYRGPFDHNSPFSYFPLFPEPATLDGIFRNAPGIPSDIQFTEAEVDQLAKIEHQRWCAEQYLAGWQHGTDHSTTDLTHPDLVPWDRLSDVVKNYDRQPVNQIPQLLGLIGLQPVRSSLPSIPLNNEESNVAD